MKWSYVKELAQTVPKLYKVQNICKMLMVCNGAWFLIQTQIKLLLTIQRIELSKNELFKKNFDVCNLCNKIGVALITFYLDLPHQAILL